MVSERESQPSFGKTLRNPEEIGVNIQQKDDHEPKQWKTQRKKGGHTEWDADVGRPHDIDCDGCSHHLNRDQSSGGIPVTLQAARRQPTLPLQKGQCDKTQTMTIQRSLGTTHGGKLATRMNKSRSLSKKIKLDSHTLAGSYTKGNKLEAGSKFSPQKNNGKIQAFSSTSHSWDPDYEEEEEEEEEDDDDDDDDDDGSDYSEEQLKARNNKSDADSSHLPGGLHIEDENGARKKPRGGSATTVGTPPRNSVKGSEQSSALSSPRMPLPPFPAQKLGPLGPNPKNPASARGRADYSHGRGARSMEDAVDSVTPVLVSPKRAGPGRSPVAKPTAAAASKHLTPPVTPKVRSTFVASPRRPVSRIQDSRGEGEKDSAESKGEVGGGRVSHPKAAVALQGIQGESWQPEDTPVGDLDGL